jgi:hypothetical protein
MIVLLLIILSVFFFALIPGRIRANRAAAKMLELQAVAAMTEDMKAAYWAQKQAQVNPLISYGKPARRMLLVFLGIIFTVVAVGIIFGGNG